MDQPMKDQPSPIPAARQEAPGVESEVNPVGSSIRSTLLGLGWETALVYLPFYSLLNM